MAARLSLKPRSRKVAVARYPLTLEIKYASALRGIVNDLERITLDEAKRTLPEIINEIDREKNKTLVNVRNDALTGWAATLFNFFLRVADRVGIRLNAGLNSVEEMSKDVNRVSRLQWSKQIRSAYGVDILRGEPQLAPLLSAWEQENISLIKSIPEQIISQMRGQMMKALLEGAGMKDLAKIIRERSGVGRSRAELIARDQIGRLNGQLAEHRQRSIGIQEYIWRTSQDERVRPTHRVRNGKTYRWDAAGIRPGSDIRCRCNAEPVFPEIFGTEVLPAS